MNTARQVSVCVCLRGAEFIKNAENALPGVARVATYVFPHF